MKKSLEKLPEYQECLEAIENRTATPLHRFIYENEPAGTDDAKVFRGMLAEVILAERSQAPETNLPHRWVYAMGKYYCQACGVEGSCNGAVSQPDSRDEMIVLMQEALEKLSHIQSTGKNAIGQYVCCGGETQRFSHYEDENNLKGRVYVQNVHKDDCFLRLIPALPATTLRLEAERKVIEIADRFTRGHASLSALTEALAKLDSLGGGK